MHSPERSRRVAMHLKSVWPKDDRPPTQQVRFRACSRIERASRSGLTQPPLTQLYLGLQGVCVRRRISKMPSHRDGLQLRRLFPPLDADVIIKLDLPAADPADDTPPVIGGVIFEFLVAHHLQNPELHRMGNEHLRPRRQRRRYLVSYRR